MKKIFWIQICVKGSKIWPETRGFFCHFLKFGLLNSFEIACSDALQQFLTSSRDKIHEKNSWG